MNSFDMRIDHSSAMDRQANSGSDSAATLWLAAMDENGLDENGHPKAAPAAQPDASQPPDASSKPAENMASATPHTSWAQQAWDVVTNPHTLLTAASFIPEVGSIASAADGALYDAEGDHTNAKLSYAAAAIGVVTDAGAARVALKAGSEALGLGCAGEAAAKVAEAEHAAAGVADASNAVDATAEVGKVAEAGTETILLSKSKFGHTFTTHGQDATEFLTNRARAMDEPNGQFLDDQAAARFIQNNVDKARGGAVSIPIPEGFPARMINPDGSFSPAHSIRLVPGGKGVKTAFPEP